MVQPTSSMAHTNNIPSYVHALHLSLTKANDERPFTSSMGNTYTDCPCASPLTSPMPNTNNKPHMCMPLNSSMAKTNLTSVFPITTSMASTSNKPSMRYSCILPTALTSTHNQPNLWVPFISPLAKQPNSYDYESNVPYTMLSSNHKSICCIFLLQ